MVFQPRVHTPKRREKLTSDSASPPKPVRPSRHVRAIGTRIEPPAVEEYLVELLNRNGRVIQTTELRVANLAQAVAQAKDLLEPVRMMETPFEFRILNRNGVRVG